MFRTSEKSENSFDSTAFLNNFQGMEDLAWDTIARFIETLPSLLSSIASAIAAKSPKDLELTAHALKGTVSNFYAEPSRTLAFQLEKMGREKSLELADSTFKSLKKELKVLCGDLKSLSKQKAEGKAA